MHLSNTRQTCPDFCGFAKGADPSVRYFFSNALSQFGAPFRGEMMRQNLHDSLCASLFSEPD